MGHCCNECKKGKKCKDEYTIEKPKPKLIKIFTRFLSL